jgi:hypothetical protein
MTRKDKVLVVGFGVMYRYQAVDMFDTILKKLKDCRKTGERMDRNQFMLMEAFHNAYTSKGWVAK